ncbi:MAG: ROK family protein [Paracoccaceae bacterium]
MARGRESAANLNRVLAEIRRLGAAARVDIAAATGLSAATVTLLSADLIAAGLVEEAASEAPNARGRPRVMLRLSPGALHVAGAKLSDSKITVAILDFAGAIVAEAAAPLLSRRPTVAQMLTQLDLAFAVALETAGLMERDIAAIGLGAPGFVEGETGRCLWSPVLSDPAPVDLLGPLRARFGCPVFVDNDANLATLAELWFGLGRGRRDFLVVTIEHGLGMGAVIGGRLFRGARGVGVEFGHIKVQNDGALCRCGQRGCLEAYVADYALAREAGAALGTEVGQGPLLEQLFASARGGDAAAQSIFRRAGRMLGLGLANLVNLFDPPLVILSGERMRHEPLFAEAIMAALSANILKLDRPDPEIEVHRWGDTLWARGAGALALDGITPDLAAARRAGASPRSV